MHYTPLINAMVPAGAFPYSWEYNPITEMENRDLHTKGLSTRLQAGLTFKIVNGLTFDTKIQYERIKTDSRDLYGESTYYVRNLVNTSSAWNRANNVVTQNLPSGSILEESTYTRENYSFRNRLNRSEERRVGKECRSR